MGGLPRTQGRVAHQSLRDYARAAAARAVVLRTSPSVPPSWWARRKDPCTARCYTACMGTKDRASAINLSQRSVARRPEESRASINRLPPLPARNVKGILGELSTELGIAYLYQERSDWRWPASLEQFPQLSDEELGTEVEFDLDEKGHVSAVHLLIA